MTKKELLKKALYMQYPISYTRYVKYNIAKEIHKLPLPKKGMMYDNWIKNANHFTTLYHRTFSLPLLGKILSFGFNENDFFLVDKKCNGFDVSFLHPKKEFRFEVFGYNRNEHFVDISFDDLMTNNSTKKDITDYHRLYKYSHENSRIINKTIDSNRKLFVSGDSQMIPDVLVLACYFKEVWYFDNRDNLTLYNYWKGINFSDVLIELNCASLKQYIDKNLK